jgi:protein transport protein SEC9
MEDEISTNLNILEQGMGRVKTVAMALGQEVDAHNKHLDRIGGKVDRVDDEIALNKSRLDRFK